MQVIVIKSTNAICIYSWFSQFSGNLPQKPQGSPDLFSIGFWLAQVPANSPSFVAHILIAIPNTANSNKPIVINANFIRNN